MNSDGNRESSSLPRRRTRPEKESGAPSVWILSVLSGFRYFILLFLLSVKGYYLFEVEHYSYSYNRNIITQEVAIMKKLTAIILCVLILLSCSFAEEDSSADSGIPTFGLNPG